LRNEAVHLEHLTANADVLVSTVVLRPKRAFISFVKWLSD